MKETPLMFSTDNVIRIVKSLKTQTRRAMNPQPFNQALIPLLVTSDTWGWFKDGRKDLPEGRLFKCPFGGVGDQIWVKETIAKYLDALTHKEGCFYKAEGGLLPDQRWTPAIFMPKRYARIWLTLAEPCRLERLQGISDEDIFAEGLESAVAIGKDGWDNPRDWYHQQWDNLNAKRGHGWDTNLWVWVITHNAFGVRLK